MLAHKVDKKEPITPEILKSLVDRYATEQATLADIRTLTMLAHKVDKKEPMAFGLNWKALLIQNYYLDASLQQKKWSKAA